MQNETMEMGKGEKGKGRERRSEERGMVGRRGREGAEQETLLFSPFVFRLVLGLFHIGVFVFLNHIVGTALHNAGGGDQGQCGLFLQFGNGQGTAIAHGGFDLGKGHGHIVVETSGVRHIGVHALLEGKLFVTSQIIALPVPCPGRAFPPVFLVVNAADADLVGGAFIKPGKIPTQHHKIGTHGQSQSDVVVVDDAAVGADRHIHSGFLVIAVPFGAYIDQCGSLSSADALGFPGDADRAAADADFDEVRACLSEETEALAVNDVARADLYVVSVLRAYP